MRNRGIDGRTDVTRSGGKTKVRKNLKRMEKPKYIGKVKEMEEGMVQGKKRRTSVRNGGMDG